MAYWYSNMSTPSDFSILSRISEGVTTVNPFSRRNAVPGVVARRHVVGLDHGAQSRPAVDRVGHDEVDGAVGHVEQVHDVGGALGAGRRALEDGVLDGAGVAQRDAEKGDDVASLGEAAVGVGDL